jgi:hypothetical protein
MPDFYIEASSYAGVMLEFYIQLAFAVVSFVILAIAVVLMWRIFMADFDEIVEEMFRR